MLEKQYLTMHKLSPEPQSYLIVLKPTINNLYVSINDPVGKLLRTFNFAAVYITAVDHRKRTVFAGEFGEHFGRYLLKSNSMNNLHFEVKVKGADARCFAFLKGLVKVGVVFKNLKIQSISNHNGCRPAKQKRL